MKQVLGIWAVALVVTAGGLFYMNASLDAIEIESVTVGLVNASDAATIPRLQVSNSVLVGVESFQGGDDNIGYRVQPAQSKVQ